MKVRVPAVAAVGDLDRAHGADDAIGELLRLPRAAGEQLAEAAGDDIKHGRQLVAVVVRDRQREEHRRVPVLEPARDARLEVDGALLPDARRTARAGPHRRTLFQAGPAGTLAGNPDELRRLAGDALGGAGSDPMQLVRVQPAG